MKSLCECVKEWALKCRFTVLVLMGLCGLLLVLALHRFGEFFLVLFCADKLSGVLEKFFASLYVIFLGLPTLAMLWFFRTTDTLEQIRRTKESTEASTLFGALEMLFAGNPTERAIVKNATGFAHLMNLRQQGLHQSIIDLATRTANFAGLDLTAHSLRGADLSFARLQKANLSGMDLTETKLRYADLIDANLLNANLQGVDLANATLSGANLIQADLRGADLRNAVVARERYTPHGSPTMLRGARYSADTQFPVNQNPPFDPEALGMKKEN